MIDVERTLRLLDVEAESNFVQAEAIDAINYLREENERLREELEQHKVDANELCIENARLRETLQYIADPYHNSTTSKDRLAFLARKALGGGDG